MILTKNDLLTEAKTMNKKLMEFIENNTVAPDFKIKVIRHSIILYTKQNKGDKAQQYIDKYFELAKEYVITIKNKSQDNAAEGENDQVLSEIKSQMQFMKRVRAIVLFKMGNKADALKSQKMKE